ncbi:uncharacterized protein LOC133832333 [Humulus lupulus]|uniref:uncharacterized protein LOC133832333 n=1 Tax=Humulus lupulus TaxID=3486 RepID=UPI002B4036F4|nr:uncharacterized protein LOC133832333 [Humulus lupulus]
MDFSYNNIYQSPIGMAPYEMLYGCKFRSPLHWDKVGEKKIFCHEDVKETSEVIEKIRQRMLIAQSRHKSHVDHKRRDIMFLVCKFMFLRASPMKGVMHFGKKGKLSLRFIGPFDILDILWQVAYRFALPPALAEMCNVFHISMLCKYQEDPSHVLRYESLQLKQDLANDEQPERIIEEGVKELKSKKIPLVKVL